MGNLCESDYAKKLEQENINIGDCVAFTFYINNYGDCNGKGIVEIEFNKFNQPKLKIRVIEVSYEFYLNWTFEVSRFIKLEKIEMSIEEKVTHLQLAKYQSTVNHIKSRWFKEERELLNSLWKKYSKAKDRVSSVLDDYIKSRKEKGLNANYKYNMFHCMVWILEFTNQKTHTKKSLLNFDFMQ